MDLACFFAGSIDCYRSTTGETVHHLFESQPNRESDAQLECMSVVLSEEGIRTANSFLKLHTTFDWLHRSVVHRSVVELHQSVVQ